MIVIISGSPRGKNSKTTQAAVQLAEAVGRPYRLFEAGSWNVRYCTGCEHCFRYGVCAQEHADDLAEILQALKSAEAVIFASPVYANEMSGQMKTLIDRMSVQLHLISLLGIPAAALTTASRSGAEYVAGRLAYILEFLGASVVDKICLSDRAPDKEWLSRASKKLSDALAQETLPVSTSTGFWFRNQNRQFKALLSIRELLPDSMLGEALQWEKEGYLAYPDAQTAAAAMRSRRAAKAENGGQNQ